MRILASIAAAALACVVLARDLPAARAEEDRAARDAALEAARTLIPEARKQPRANAETVKQLKAVRSSLEPFVAPIRTGHWDPAKGGKNEAFAKTWNELVTVCAYHGVVGKPVYVLDREVIMDSRYLLGLPTGSGWSQTRNTDPTNSDQLRVIVSSRTPAGEDLRRIKVWCYRWDTVYSGVGGENYKGLAKMMYDVDRDSTAKSGRKSSGNITPRRINAEFDRVYYYYVEGFDVDEEKKLRRDNYYMKGDNLSFNFEVITYMDPAATDDDVTKWQRTDADPEIAAVLESLASAPDRKK